MKYAATNALIGGSMAFLAARGGVFGLLLAWLGLDFLVLGMCYLLNKPAWLGKRPDGTLTWWSQLVWLPLHMLMLLVWHSLRMGSAEPAYQSVNSSLKLGRRLLSAEMPCEVKVVVDLTAEFSEPAGVREGRDYRSFPILDASVPDALRLRQFIAGLPEGMTYIHCAQGHGRTGLFAVAWLLQRRLCPTLEDALALIKSARPGIELNSTQKNFIGQFSITLQASP